MPHLLIALVIMGISYTVAIIIITRVTRSKKSLRPAQPPSPISPQQVAALVQPYRQSVARAVSLHRDIYQVTVRAPAALRDTLEPIEADVRSMLEAILPQAQRASQLEAQRLHILDDDPQQPELQARAQQMQQELEAFVARLEAMRTRIWRLEHEAQALSNEHHQKRLEAHVQELEALESAFVELNDGLEPVPRKPF